MSEPHVVSAPARMRVVATRGAMNVYRRKGFDKPYVVGHERFGRLVLLEEFGCLKAAKQWAEENKEG
jgi:hypothetical protein